MSGLPRWVEPGAATLTDRRFSDPDWVFERKLDGERTIAFCEQGAVRMYSRNRKPQNRRYPELAEALAERALGAPMIVDGEVVAFEGDRTSFPRLQGRIQIDDPERARRSGIAVKLYLFDVLFLEGADVRRRPLRQRKQLLKEAVDFVDPIRLTTHRNERGIELFEQACRDGWEGLIAKRADAPYPSGRSRDWLKFKCDARQELVVVGWTEPKGSRTGFGALLLAYNDGAELRYAGRVGTGFDEATLADLAGRLRDLERETAPVADAPSARKGVHWARPELVAEVGFTEWTGDGRLRHPRFLGLRRDKEPGDVVREDR